MEVWKWLNHLCTLYLWCCSLSIGWILYWKECYTDNKKEWILAANLAEAALASKHLHFKEPTYCGQDCISCIKTRASFVLFQVVPKSSIHIQWVGTWRPVVTVPAYYLTGTRKAWNFQPRWLTIRSTVSKTSFSFFNYCVAVILSLCVTKVIFLFFSCPWFFSPHLFHLHQLCILRNEF